MPLQENYRTTYKYKDSFVELEEWPHLNPYCEVESPTVEELIAVIKDIGLDWNSRNSNQVGHLYMLQYDLTWPEVKKGFKLYFNQLFE